MTTATVKTGCGVDVLLVDESEPFLLSVERGLTELGCKAWSARNFDEAERILRSGLASHVVSEARIGGRNLLDFMDDVRQLVPVERFVVATSYPSVAAAVELTKMGVAGYLSKPTPATAILDVLLGTVTDLEAVEQPSQWPSLDRVIWEYLNQVYVSAGSMSEAARRLNLDRRSLRRMLAKYPPCR